MPTPILLIEEFGSDRRTRSFWVVDEEQLYYHDESRPKPRKLLVLSSTWFPRAVCANAFGRNQTQLVEIIDRKLSGLEGGPGRLGLAKTRRQYMPAEITSLSHLG